ncbi:hypothetical protein JMJ35_001875 [Cladonia borealis]|uniref:Uncharacterized protein n=1 Tax=Cladonia borealis TaxID=184061 RepID=A0AA39R9B1_9LECA|nr:hypothetical protein JMJ35_001875 [Cladonia borealis]
MDTKRANAFRWKIRHHLRGDDICFFKWHCFHDSATRYHKHNRHSEYNKRAQCIGPYKHERYTESNNNDEYRGLQPPPSQTGTSDPALVTACSQNSILPSSNVWSAYEANSYLSSILSAAAPAPTDPQVDAGKLLSNDIGESTDCNYNTNCAPIVCKDVRNNGFGNLLLAQRFLAYTAYINFSNFFYEMWNALFNAATLGIGSIDDITITFFTDPTPAATFEQILGLLTPLLTILSVALSPFTAGGSLLITAMGGVVGETIAGGNVANLAPVIDQRFSEAGKISAFVTSYLKSVSAGIQTGYHKYVGNASAAEWCGSPFGDPNGIFGSGFWVDSNHMSNFQTDLYSSFVKTLAYKSINYAWNDSNAFIIYVPYGVKIKLTSGDFGEVDQTYCETLQTSAQEKVLTVCDGMNGMARIFNGNQATVGNQLMSTTPMGWNSNYEILSGEPFDTSAAIRGSVASWAAGDFNYDVSDQFSDQLNSGALDDATAVAIGNLNISESTAGFFNIPVCKVYDLASFPPASPNGYPCACAYTSATGGTSGSTEKFSNYVSSTINNLVYPSPIAIPQSTTLFNVCEAEQYTGSG